MFYFVGLEYHEQLTGTTLHFPDTSIPHASRLDRDDYIRVFDYGDEGVIMSLFQCEHCGCCENTALSSQGFYWSELFDWAGIEDRRGKKLCSACGPSKYSDGTKANGGEWHGEFDRVFLPMGMYRTAGNGNLEHVETGDQDFRKHEVINE